MAQDTAKQDFTLHVALIMKQDDLSKNAATVRAYTEGARGLDQRLGQGKLPLEEQPTKPEAKK